MKTKKISTTIIGVMAGLIILSMSVTAQAVLSDNLLINYDFATNSITTLNSGTSPLNDGQWYRSASWAASNGYAFIGNNITAALFQAVDVSQAGVNYVASTGPVRVTLDYTGKNINALTSVVLYGSHSQPSYGSSYGTTIGTMNGFSNTADNTTWVRDKYMQIENVPGYDWYTLVINGKSGSGQGYFGVDNIRVQVTPVPAAVWLLGSGLLGIGIWRRRSRA